MPVVFQSIYRREDAIRNRDVLYVFSDNLARFGMMGQAGEMRREPNAVGVATRTSLTAYFGEEPLQVIAQKRAIDKDMQPLFAHVIEGGIVVWPANGLEFKLSRLSELAPSTMDHLERKLLALVRVGKLHSKGRLIQAREEVGDHL